MFIYRIVRENLSKTINSEKYNPHLLRHTFATIMCVNGANISDVRDMLDHKNISSTELNLGKSITYLDVN